MIPGTTHLFVYGSLRSGFQSPAYEYISGYFEPLGSAKVKGVLVDLGEYPAAVPVETGHFIIGELYRLRHEAEYSWAFGQLDDYEGVVVEADEAQLYRRETTTVFAEDGTEYTAWIYWYNGNVTGYPIIASGDIIEYIKSKQA
jgi:gamma-glutamylcyclotransferase (GGCT)/AIG2-like uncharacterized protein YtfP